MGALRTSEEGEVVGGEAKQAKSDDNRAVDAPGRIIIDSAPAVTLPAPPKPVPKPPPMPTAPQRAGGLWFVVLLYVLGAAALGAAVYERFVA